jgi:hypothetical protein
VRTTWDWEAEVGGWVGLWMDVTVTEPAPARGQVP